MRPTRWLGTAAAAVSATTMLAAQAGPGPSFRDVIDLKNVGSPSIAPNGKAVAYTIRTTEWKDNRFDTEIWLWREGEEPIQLTRTPKGSSASPRWSPDGKWIGFLADRGDRQQLYVIGSLGGEAIKLTYLKDGVADYRWSPDSRSIALLALEPEAETATKRKTLYGDFAVEDQEYRQSHLWLLAVDPEKATDSAKAPKPTRLTEGVSTTVMNFAWSPDGTRIAYEQRRDPLINSATTADVSVITVADRSIKPVVHRLGFDGGPVWSPDGQWLLFMSAGMDTLSNFYKNNQLMKVAAGGGTPTRLAASFDEQIGNVIWTRDAIWFGAAQKTKRGVFRLDPETGAITGGPVAGMDAFFGLDVSPDGRFAAFVAQPNAGSLAELYRSEMGSWSSATKITDLSAQIASWNVGTSEVVSWPSRDGTVIEGVLHKPRDFQAGKRYPLFVVIHGGPTGVDSPQPVPFYVYPIPEWVAKGAVVLRPNYRGSAGYGEKFRSLNVRNLGVGDLWDVMSGVDYLIKQGIVDSTRMAAMGWSQGGYISAFLTTNTPRFKAISVGAGISNWVTYYVATDIHPFTRQYLQATPWNDMAIYQRTSPMTSIKQARTPTLIQHGEFDTRVPTQNAVELYQGLQDQGVPTKLVIYKGFGHGISKPKEQLAAVWHNWQWFGKYIWNENIEIPLEDRPLTGDGGKEGKEGGQR